MPPHEQKKWMNAWCQEIWILFPPLPGASHVSLKMWLALWFSIFSVSIIPMLNILSWQVKAGFSCGNSSLEPVLGLVQMKRGNDFHNRTPNWVKTSPFCVFLYKPKTWGRFTDGNIWLPKQFLFIKKGLEEWSLPSSEGNTVGCCIKTVTSDLVLEKIVTKIPNCWRP